MNTPARQVLTPSSLNRAARDLLEGEFPLVWIEGELSNFARPSSGHLYFTLKDSAAQVRCAMFRQKAMFLRFKPADGAHVLLRARVSLYEGRGEFQLIVEHMEEAGEGALRRQFEQLKAKLAAEGLFDDARKRELPRLPRRIGVVTSPTGAALRDVLSVIERRCPMVDIDVIPVPVQGNDAAPRIVAALEAAYRSARHDVILVTRGGGSLEDLFAFNDERLARTIAASPVPVVSAIGHEIDFTIADFVADLRAPTPSAAAELLVPHQDALARELERYLRALRTTVSRTLRDRSQRTDLAFAKLQSRRPDQRLRFLSARANALYPRLARAAQRSLLARAERLDRARQQLERNQPDRRAQALRERLLRLDATLARLVQRRIERNRLRLGELRRALHAVSPLATLSRGYAIVRDAQGNIVRDARAVAPGDSITARVAEGEIAATVVRSS